MAKINWLGELGAALQGVNQALQAYRQQQIQDLLMQLNLKREERQSKLDELRMNRELEEQQLRRQERAQAEADKQAYATYIEENKDAIARSAGIPQELVGLLTRIPPQLGMNLLTQTTMEGMREKKPRYQTVGNALVRIDPETQQATPVFQGRDQSADILQRQIALQEWEQRNKLIPVIDPSTGKRQWATVSEAKERGLVPISAGMENLEKKIPQWVDMASDPVKQIGMVNMYKRDPNLAARALKVSPEDRPVFDAMMDQLITLYDDTGKKDKKAKETKPPKEGPTLGTDISGLPSGALERIGMY